MSDYEQGFAAGERQAFNDRRGTNSAELPEPPHRNHQSIDGFGLSVALASDEYHRGWWDGYLPRSITWHRPPARAFSGVPA